MAEQLPAPTTEATPTHKSRKQRRPSAASELRKRRLIIYGSIAGLVVLLILLGLADYWAVQPQQPGSHTRPA